MVVGGKNCERTGLCHMCEYSHTCQLSIFCSDKEVYEMYKTSIFDIQGVNFQLLCLHLVPHAEWVGGRES